MRFEVLAAVSINIAVAYVSETGNFGRQVLINQIDIGTALRTEAEGSFGLSVPIH
jgi:hypothetical protein